MENAIFRFFLRLKVLFTDKQHAVSIYTADICLSSDFRLLIVLFLIFYEEKKIIYNEPNPCENSIVLCELVNQYINYGRKTLLCNV